uniref:Uncharacterized protein n=1 Tax=Glossina pallidipes TaxID=7398 RepID=A0A1B0AAQ0_GLOPL
MVETHLAGIRALLKSDVFDGTTFVMCTSGSSGNGIGSKFVKLILKVSVSISNFWNFSVFLLRFPGSLATNLTKRTSSSIKRCCFLRLQHMPLGFLQALCIRNVQRFGGPTVAIAELLHGILSLISVLETSDVNEPMEATLLFSFSSEEFTDIFNGIAVDRSTCTPPALDKPLPSYDLINKNEISTKDPVLQYSKHLEESLPLPGVFEGQLPSPSTPSHTRKSYIPWRNIPSFPNNEIEVPPITVACPAHTQSNMVNTKTHVITKTAVYFIPNIDDLK